MIPNTRTVEVVTNHNGKSFEATIDPSSIGHVMSMLAGLYSNVYEAILRELSVNGLDSCIAAGVNRPIEVTLPSRLNSDLVIRDYGLGLSVDDLMNLYARYGTSTKRDSNDFTGSLGVGKFAVASYVDTWSMIAVKDGVKATALLSKNSAGISTIHIVDTVVTNEPNGVSITVPTKPGDEGHFNRAAQNIFKWWNKGTVLVNGKQPVHFSDWNSIDLGGGYHVVPGHSTDVIIMGGVAYPIEEERRLTPRRYHNEYSAAIFVGMGDVAFTPSREALNYDKQTVQKLREVKEEFNTRLADHVTSQIAASKTHYDAVVAAYDFRRYEVTAQYRGEDIPDACEVHVVYADHTSHDLGSSPRSLKQGAVIAGFKGKRVSVQQRAKIMKHMKSLGVETKNGVFVIAGESIDPKWLSNDNTIYQWANIVKEKISTTPAGFTWGVLNRFGGVDEVDTLGDKIVYVTPDNKPQLAQRESFYNEHPDHQIVIKRQKYAGQFEKAYPNAMSLFQFAKQKQAELNTSIAGVSEYDYHELQNLKRLTGQKIDDPEIVKHIEAAKTYVAPRTRGSAFLRSMLGYSYMNSVPVVSVFKDYPLVNSYNNPIDHMVIYINAVWNNNQESK